MLINQKIRIEFNREAEDILDSQSRMCNKLYNMLLEKCNTDRDTGYAAHYFSGRNLRNEVVRIKQENPYLYSVHSSPLKNTALRLKSAFDRFFKEKAVGYPRFKSNNISWFSLLYDEPNKGIKIKSKHIKISLGYTLDENGKKQRLHIEGMLAEKVKPDGSVRNYRIVKQYNKFYIIVCLNVEENKITKGTRIISIDPNHTNFFVGIDNNGKSIELNKLCMISYFDKQISKIQSKRDKCFKKSIKCISQQGVEYYKSSRRYTYLNNVLKKIYIKRKEQIKTGLFTIAHKLCDEYDTIAIGDYTPVVDLAKYKAMRRAMLNQTQIGNFRKILEYVCKKRQKTYILVDEYNTTKKCFCCGDLKPKDPSIRSYVCPVCGEKYNRDINSAINIGIKANLLSSSDYVGLDLSNFTYTARYDLYKQEISTGIK